MTQNRNSKIENRNSKLKNHPGGGFNAIRSHSRASGNALGPGLLLAAVLLAGTVGSAQQPVTGFPPFSSQTPSIFDTVNDADLNVSFSIPVVKKAGRGLPFQYSLAYNSSVWSKWNSIGNLAWTPVGGWGWAGTSSASTGSITHTESQGECQKGGQVYYWNIYDFGSYSGPNGTLYPLGAVVSTWTNSIPCGSGAPSTYTKVLTDGSGYTIKVTSAPSATVYTRSGLAITVPVLPNYPGSIYDANGNSIAFATSSGTTTFTDTLGLTALTASGSGTPSSPMQYTYPWWSGQVSVQVNYASYTVQTNFGCSGIAEYGPTQAYLVSTISMPDGTTYFFNYETTPGYSPNVTGRLASVTLPTGATISYSYSGGSNGITCQDGSAATLTREVNPGSGGPAGTWTYVHTEGTSTSTTTITDPGSNVTDITFYGAYAYSNAYEQERKVYNNSGTLMETVDTCYNGASIPCVGTTVSLPITNRTVEVTLPNLSPSEISTTYNTYGLPTETDEYDYGPSLVRKTLLSYSSCGVTDTYVVDRPCSVTIQNASGGAVAGTTYSYDGNGNLLSETRTNTGGSPTSISRSFTYGSYGVLQTSTDFKGNKTTYSNFTCGNNTAFPQTITSPISSLAVSRTWNCNGAVPTSVADPNSETTTYVYNDPFWRLTETDYPDGGKTTTTYTDSDSGFSVATSRLLSGSTYHTVTQYLDGLGRVNKSVDTQASSEVDTTYDSLGRVSSVSNPYASTSDKTYGLTVYGYDTLSRVTSITYPDTGATSISYSGNCWTTKDPAGKQRTLCSDALGRTTSVTEDPSGLGYQTTYTYDDLNDLTAVTQGSQTRTYSYDMLARLTKAQVPEANVSGTQCSTTYDYDANGNLTSKTAPLENQSSSCTTTVTTTYGYDGVNRLTSKTHSDSTPPASYSYDQTSVTIGSWSSGTLTNPKGRLTEATTTSSSSVQTAVVYSYDPVGRTKSFWQCTPSNCGSATIWGTQYNYDLAGDVTSWVHPAGYTLTNSINSAQQVTAVQSSWQDSGHPQYLAQNVTYTPWGAVSQLEDGCAGSGCVNALETYTYNNRLQPWMIEVGTSSNASADYCLVYNYFSSWTAPSSCPSATAVPKSGSANNGNVMGYWFEDNANSSFSHTATYGYDTLNRLITAVATGSFTYNLNFNNYDRYGNMTCVQNSNTNGPCPTWTFNGNNQINTSGFSYDAAGHLTADGTGTGTHTYQYDAEGQLVSLDSGSTESYTYNALRQQVRLVTPGYYAWDHLYDATGLWIGRLNNNAWAASGVFHLGGQPFAIYIDQAYFIHVNALGSTATNSNAAGGDAGDIVFCPWGQVCAGAAKEWHYGGFQYQVSASGLMPSLFRQYSMGKGRWMSPDPLGGDVTNPQSFNGYAYVTNNPTTLVDPLGLQGCPPGTRSIGYGQCAGPVSSPMPSPWWDLFDLQLYTTCPGHGEPCATGFDFGGAALADLLLMTQGGGGAGGGSGGGATNNGPQSRTSTCTVTNGRTTAPSPEQEARLGAGPFGVPPAGSVAIDPWALGLLPGKHTNDLLGPYASQITFSFSPTPNLPPGFPTTMTLGSIVGPASVRVGGSQFNGLLVFDIFGLPGSAAVGAATSPRGVPVAVTVTYPSSLPINCGGPIWDPIPPTPGIS